MAEERVNLVVTVKGDEGGFRIKGDKGERDASVQRAVNESLDRESRARGFKGGRDEEARFEAAGKRTEQRQNRDFNAATARAQSSVPEQRRVKAPPIIGTVPPPPSGGGGGGGGGGGPAGGGRQGRLQRFLGQGRVTTFRGLQQSIFRRGAFAAASGGLSVGGVVGAGAAIGGIAAVGGFALAVKKASDRLAQLAESAAELNGAIAVQRAQSELQIFLARRGQAAQLAPTLVPIQQARTDLAKILIRIETRFLELMGPFVLTATEALILLAAFAEEFFERLGGAFASIGRIVRQIPIASSIVRIIERMLADFDTVWNDLVEKARGGDVTDVELEGFIASFLTPRTPEG